MPQVRPDTPRAYRFEHVTRDIISQDMQFRQTAPRPGDRFPDFDLRTTAGGRIRADGLLGRPHLMVMSSVTCPMTASSNPILKRLHAGFGDRVDFVTIYVREAHPGEHFRQSRSYDEKVEHARALERRDALPWMVIVDDLEGSLHRALDEKPNPAYLVGADGRIVFRALWAGDEAALRPALDAAAHGERPDRRESQSRLMPMAAGLGRMREVLRESGHDAERDIWRAAPPIALIAWTAGLFRPLPAHWRTAAAAAAIGAIAGAGIGLAIRAAARARR